MAESTLTLTLDDYRDIVTRFVYGGDGDYTNLTAAQQARVDETVNSGLRRFYDPPPIQVDGVIRRADWTFLKPRYRLSLNGPYSDGTIAVSSGVVTLSGSGAAFPSWAANAFIEIDGIDYEVDTRDSDTQLTLLDTTLDVDAGTSYSLHQDDYELPDDFGYPMGSAYYVQGDNAWYECKLVPFQTIESLRMRDYNQNFSTGEPQIWAVRPKDHDASTGYRKFAMFWPQVTNDSTAIIYYRRRPDALVNDGDIPWGGSDHSETIKLSCLAAAEELMDEADGVFQSRFREMLITSLKFDARDNRPRELGQMIDVSDGLEGYPRRHELGINSAQAVTYKGTGSP